MMVERLKALGKSVGLAYVHRTDSCCTTDLLTLLLPFDI